MSWNMRIYGKENPPVSQKVKVITLFIFMGLWIYGTFTDFIPSKPLAWWGFRITFIPAGVIVLLIFWGYSSGRIKTPEYLHMSKWKIYGLVLFTPFFIYIIIWLTFIKALPDLYTIVSGKPHAEVFKLEKRLNSRGHLFQLEGEALNRTFPSCVSIPFSLYRKLPSGPVQIKLVGKQTALGFHVVSAYPYDERIDGIPSQDNRM